MVRMSQHATLRLAIIRENTQSTYANVKKNALHCMGEDCCSPTLKPHHHNNNNKKKTTTQNNEQSFGTDAFDPATNKRLLYNGYHHDRITFKQNKLLLFSLFFSNVLIAVVP